MVSKPAIGPFVGAESATMGPDWLPPNAVPPRAPLQPPRFLTLVSEHLQAGAVDLRPQGVAEAGFLAAAAVAVVSELAAQDLTILGGDVWISGEGRNTEPAYWNWAADRSIGEPWDSYVRRAATLALDRISFFDELARTEAWGIALFVLVPSTERHLNELMAKYASQAPITFQGRAEVRTRVPANDP